MERIPGFFHESTFVARPYQKTKTWDACVRRKSETGETQMKMISITELWKKECMCIWCVDANTHASTKSPRVCMKQSISILGDLPFD